MNREEIGELAAAYALGGLEGEDRARFEALLERGRPGRGARAPRLRGHAGRSWPPRPPRRRPPAVKAALMERIAAAAARRRGPLPRRPRALWPVGAERGHGRRARRDRGRLVASRRPTRSGSTRWRADAEQLQAELRSQQTVIAILRDPATQVVALAGPAAGADRAGAHDVARPGRRGVRRHRAARAARRARPTSSGPSRGAMRRSRRVSSPWTRRGRGASRCGRCPGWRRSTPSRCTLEPAGGLPAPSGEMYLLGKS